MNSKNRNQFSNGHPNKGQQPSMEKGAAAPVDGDMKADAALSPHKKFHDPFGAPHFPPSENLPPQAKRLAMAKKKKAAELAARTAQRVDRAGMPSPEAYPDALPRVAEAKAAVTQTWSHMTHDAEPVLKEAKGHWSSLREAAMKIWSEAGMLVRTPAVLMRVLLQARRA